MAIKVECIIKITEYPYEGAVKQTTEVMQEVGWTSSTGKFSAVPRLFLEKWVRAATDHAVEATNRKLLAIKGDA